MRLTYDRCALLCIILLLYYIIINVESVSTVALTFEGTLTAQKVLWQKYIFLQWSHMVFGGLFDYGPAPMWLTGVPYSRLWKKSCRLFRGHNRVKGQHRVNDQSVQYLPAVARHGQAQRVFTAGLSWAHQSQDPPQRCLHPPQHQHPGYPGDAMSEGARLVEQHCPDLNDTQLAAIVYCNDWLINFLY